MKLVRMVRETWKMLGRSIFVGERYEKSMKSIAEKYGGSIVAVAEDGWFKLSILIPSQN